MQLALKVGKPWAPNFPKPHIFQPLCYTATYKGAWPNWSWKTLALSPPMLHCFRDIWCLQHTTKIDILPHYLHGHYFFVKCIWFILGIPRQWHLIFNLMVTTMKSFSLNSEQTHADLLLCNQTGKHGQQFFRPQSTVRLTSTFVMSF